MDRAVVLLLLVPLGLGLLTAFLGADLLSRHLLRVPKQLRSLMAFALPVVAVLLALYGLDLGGQAPRLASGGSRMDGAGAVIAFVFGLPFYIVIVVICWVVVARRFAKP
jgi:predicted neutral ceramidase superfamily lipid hydrolase